MTQATDVGRICATVRGQLPDHVAGTLPRWRSFLVRTHLRRCAGCRAESARQKAVAAGLRELAVDDAASAPVPDDLLDTLLEQAAAPGVRGRVAVPARGAISGERPALTVALLVAGAATGTAVGYAGWRSVRAVKKRGRRRR